MLKTLIFSALVPASASAATGFDPPDLRFELELHNRFMRSHGLESDTPALAKDAYLEDYHIQRGENLWSMSQVLYGDGGYWPRVWAQNHGITNPHLIRPGHTLQFLMGGEDDTPAFRFTEEGGEGGVELASSNGNPAIEIPPPEIPPKPVLRVPPSFPEWQQVYKREPKPIIDDRGLAYRWPKPVQRVFLRAFVSETAVDPTGFFLENDTEAGLPVVNQYVYVKVKKGQGQLSQRMMIVHDAGPIRKVSEIYDDSQSAFLVQVAGELQLTEVIKCEFKRSRDQNNFDCFRALMTKTTGLSLKDHALIPGDLPIIDFSPNGSHGTAVAQVVGSEKSPASVLFGQGDIVFLNKGAANGVEVGQLLDVYANRRTRRSDTPVEFSPAPSGMVKVVRVTDHLATAVVVKAHDGILQGDKVQQVSSQSVELEKQDGFDFKGIEGGEIDGSDSFFEEDEGDLEKEMEEF